MSRRCSHCGHNGHNSRTCLDKGFKLFGVRLTDSSSPSSSSSIMRKSVSLGNLSSYGSSDPASPSASPLEQPELGDSLDGYASDDLVHASSSARQRKKGVPWTEDEHRSFLLGLQRLGKGDWRGISRNFVKTRTPTQVASHAQKYFLRRNNLNKRRRRSSLFDITPDAVSSLIEESLVEEPIFEGADVCPVVHELSLGHNTTHGDRRSRDASILPRHAYSIGGFPLPLPPLSLKCVPTTVPEIREEASDVGETEDLEDCEMTEVSEEALLQPTSVPPATESVPEANGSCGRDSNHLSLPFPPFPMWPGSVVQCVEKKATWFSDSKILKPTPIMPTLPLAMDDTMKMSKLSLSTTRPVMEPTPLSYKLLEEGSRHSAFHTTTSVSNSELDPQGNLSSAISVP